MRASGPQTSNTVVRTQPRSNSVYQADEPHRPPHTNINIQPQQQATDPPSPVLPQPANPPTNDISDNTDSQPTEEEIHSQQPPVIIAQPPMVPTDTSSDKHDNQISLGLPFNPMPTNSIELQRKKRHLLTPLFSYLTGLASSDDIQKLHENEGQILKAENDLSQSVEDIQKKTDDVIQAIRAQSLKMSNLYTDEKQVKTTLQALLADSNNAIEQIRSLTAAIEIQNDVSLEWSTIFSMIDLMPELIQDLHDSVFALSSQTISPNILSTEEITTKVPFHRRASMLSATITGLLKADKYILQITLPEFYPVYTIVAIKTIPISPQGQGTYSQLKIEDEFVAINNEKTTFVYNPAYCSEHNTITICAPNLITLHHKVTTCSETLALQQESDIDLCLKNVVLTKPSTQSFIYTNNMTNVRIFSPYIDGITHWCGSIIRPNATKIGIGYTDLKFNSKCTLRTNELTLISPIPPSDETDVTVEAIIPNLAQVFDLLHKDIEVTNAINLTQLSSDYKQLSKLIANETVDLTAVQEQLKLASSIKSLAEYKHFQLKIEAPEPVTNTVAALSYTTIFTFLVIFIIILHICAPNITNPIFEAIGNCFKKCFCCIITGCKALGNSPANQESNDAEMRILRPNTFRQNMFRNASFRFNRNRERLDPAYDNPNDYINNLALPTTPQPGTSNQTRQTQSPPIDTSLIHKWELIPEPEKRRARLVLKHNDDIVYYDSYRKCVIDPDGMVNTTYPNPTSSMITALKIAIAALPYPTLEKIGDRIYMKGNRNLVYNEQKRLLFNRTTRTMEDGYNIPPRESSEI